MLTFQIKKNWTTTLHTVLLIFSFVGCVLFSYNSILAFKRLPLIRRSVRLIILYIAIPGLLLCCCIEYFALVINEPIWTQGFNFLHPSLYILGQYSFLGRTVELLNHLGFSECKSLTLSIICWILMGIEVIYELLLVIYFGTAINEYNLPLGLNESCLTLLIFVLFLVYYQRKNRRCMMTDEKLFSAYFIIQAISNAMFGFYCYFPQLKEGDNGSIILPLITVFNVFIPDSIMVLWITSAVRQMHIMTSKQILTAKHSKKENVLIDDKNKADLV